MIGKQQSVVPFSEINPRQLDLISKIRADFLGLPHAGFDVSPGFFITQDAFLAFVKANKLQKKIDDLISTIHFERVDSLIQVSNHIQKLIVDSRISPELTLEIKSEYKKLGGIFKKPLVYIGENKAVDNLESLLKVIKQTWANEFRPKQLLLAHEHKRSNFHKDFSIVIQKVIGVNMKGKISTKNLIIETNSRLSNKQRKNLEELGKRLKKHFYFPHVVTWALEKNKIYIMNVKPMTNAQRSYLVLIRHGESVWNAKGLWTGWTDVELSKKGHNQARDAGLRLQDINFDNAFTSGLKRAQQTLEEIKQVKNQTNLPTVESKLLNERDYGDLTGKNKWEVEKEFGKEQFMKWRRGWDDSVPNGESLKDVYKRVVPYYEEHILPRLKSGKNVIVAAHGNSLRALVKHLENMSDSEVTKLEIPVGQILIYQIDEDGNVAGKEIRNQA